jgi:TPP-dependent pyruvate/acetoin dehydrogenase alpha subunit
MHIFDAATRFYGGNAIVGGGIPLAVGLALADRMQGRQRLSWCFFGDGAVAEGVFHESMNIASLWQLPVIFVCENNLYAMGTAIRYAQAVTDLASKGAGYAVTSEAVDGMDVLAVEAAARRAAEYVRGGNGPFFLECRTYRFRPHSMFDTEQYRTKDEVEEWKRRDPITLLTSRLRKYHVLDDAGLEALEQTVADDVAAAVACAEAGSWEPVEELTRFVCSDRSDG